MHRNGRRNHGDLRWWAAGRTVMTIGVTAAVAGAFLPGAANAGPDAREQKSLRRQLTLLEKVIDATLIESPNVRVWGSANTGGIYLPGYGIIFTAGGSLMLDSSIAEVAKQLGKVGIYSGEDEEEEEEDEGSSKIEARRARREVERRTKRLEGLKQEMTDVLADYGPTLKQLAPNEKVGIAIFLINESHEDTWDRVVLVEVLKSDLERYDNGQLSEEEFDKRVVIAEY